MKYLLLNAWMGWPGLVIFLAICNQYLRKTNKM